MTNTRPPVALIGAGPGDPELITRKAARLLQAADVVFHDALIDRGVLELARPGARLVAVGKRGGRASTPQLAIHEQLIRAWRAGLRVARLKGGDPFIFGRGGEECMALRAAGIPYEVVPGVTSGSAAATYAGVPLTYRAMSQSVLFLTGRRARGTDAIDWVAVARAADTLVIYMGVESLPILCAELLRAGRSPSTPALAVEWATINQREVAAPLAEFVGACGHAEIKSPAIIVIGDVVALRDTLAFAPAPTARGVCCAAS